MSNELQISAATWQVVKDQVAALRAENAELKKDKAAVSIILFTGLKIMDDAIAGIEEELNVKLNDMSEQSLINIMLKLAVPGRLGKVQKRLEKVQIPEDIKANLDILFQQFTTGEEREELMRRIQLITQPLKLLK
jgi:hypothetical protein